MLQVYDNLIFPGRSSPMKYVTSTSGAKTSVVTDICGAVTAMEKSSVTRRTMAQLFLFWFQL